jgi:hypothetical protein
MDSLTDNLRPWRSMLSELQAVSSGLFEKPSRAASTACSLPARSDTRRSEAGESTWASHARRIANVRIVEFSERSLTIAWHDPTSCSYYDQRWRRAKSSCIGVCVLTGAAILPGEEVFKPGRCKPPPANAGAMILVSALPVDCHGFAAAE